MQIGRVVGTLVSTQKHRKFEGAKLLIVQPLVGLLAGRSLLQAEYFGVAPDPTATATLGVLLLARRLYALSDFYSGDLVTGGMYVSAGPDVEAKTDGKAAP